MLGIVAMLTSPMDLALLLLLALLLFGAKRVPEIARSLGTGMREFKDSIEGMTRSDAQPPPHAALPPTSPAAAPSEPKNAPDVAASAPPGPSQPTSIP
jgi:sec-independent protein translocase protein TatA